MGFLHPVHGGAETSAEPRLLRRDLVSTEPPKVEKQQPPGPWIGEGRDERIWPVANSAPPNPMKTVRHLPKRNHFGEPTKPG
jgi:hypothetical protein